MLRKKGKGSEENKSLFRLIPLHFRIHKKDNRKHEVIVGGQNDREYAYMVNTHSPKSGHKPNMKLSENPTKIKKYKHETSYVVKRVEVDRKSNFSKRCHDRELGRDDHNRLVKWFRKNKLFRK